MDPHAPTRVGRHGEELPFSQGWNWRDHSLYLDQLKFRTITSWIW